MNARRQRGLWVCWGWIILLAAGCQEDSALHLVGTLERTTLELAAPISEVIVEQPLSVGEPVAAGEVVVRLDTAVAAAELRAYEAAREAAQAALAEAEGEWKRIEELRRARVKTPQDLDKARRQRDEAAAILAEKEARIAQAEKGLEDLHVRTHASGIVDQLPYEVGERAPSGGVVAVVLADEKPWARVWIPARAVSRLKPNHAAEVRITGGASWLPAVLEDVAREPSFTPHYALTEREAAHLVYEARVVLQDAPADLRPGLPVELRLRLEESP